MSPGENPRENELSLCEREPIHSPGAIQPHGAVVAALAETLLVTHASENLSAILGLPVGAVLGRKLQDAVGEAAFSVSRGDIGSALRGHGHPCSMPGPDGVTLDLRAHRSGRHISVDIERVRHDRGQRPGATMVQSVLETFEQAATPGELCELAAHGLKTITGYDRVMAYRFHDDLHGEVIAEARLARLEPFLGLHYPASDIPPQARSLYLRQRVVAIADSNYLPVPLLAVAPLDGGTPLDLTHSTLRSASPVHLKYMRHMRTAASLTVALVRGERLWGMLVCHHCTARVPGPDVRALAGMIGQVVSLLLASLGEAEVYNERLARNATLRVLVERLASDMPLAEALAAPELLRVVVADGATIRMAGATWRLGQVPPQPVAEQVLATMRTMAGGEALAIDDLGLVHPEFAAHAREASGALLLPFAGDDAILWFRPELSRTVSWGGNPADHATFDPATGLLSPRTSFDAWKETVGFRSAPWTEADFALTRELKLAVDAAETLRAKAALAQLRHYDPLTGLPNRSLLQERLTEVERMGRGGTGGGESGGDGPRAALLFLDLDRFKAVNDSMGHAAGDALLIEVARRLLIASGPDNLAARLGGDEFVVLCPSLALDRVVELGEQVRRAIEAPFDIAGRQCHISVSIGIAVGDRLGSLDMVRAADMAMYAAKQNGGNSGVVFEPSLFDRAANQLQLDRDMREALRGGDQFVLLYQPMFGIAPGIENLPAARNSPAGRDQPAARELIGFEALVRWRHPVHGWLSPGRFIAEAEKSGLLLPLGDWILAGALRQGLRFLHSRPDMKLQIAVNVSAVQLSRPGFRAGLAGALQAAGFPPAWLCLEVADSILGNVPATAVLAEVRELGVRVAIDDFGVGHSSLSWLRRLPVDIVKLDRTFLEETEGDERGVDFVRAVVAVAHAAGKPVVFEGIETQSQFDTVLIAGADMVQGFFFAPPLSANAAEDLVAQYRRPVDPSPTKAPRPE